MGNETLRLRISLELFSDVLRDENLKNVAVILVFSKPDLFEARVRDQGIPITQCFPQYQGDPFDPDTSFKYIQSQFKAKLPMTTKEFSVLKVNLTDKDSIRDVANEIARLVPATEQISIDNHSPAQSFDFVMIGWD